MNEARRIVLQSHDQYNDIVEITDSGGKIVHSKGQAPELANKCIGFFAEVEGKDVCLYRWSENLILRVGDESFNLDEKTTTKIGPDAVPGIRRFQVFKEEKPILTFKYSEPEIPREIRDDPNALFMWKDRDPEDDDFLLFIHNVLRQPDRRNRGLLKR